MTSEIVHQGEPEPEIVDKEAFPLPGGWANWSYRQKADFRKRWQKRQYRLRKAHEKLLRLAASEGKVTCRKIVVAPPEGPVDEDNPRYVIRAQYGPLYGLPASTIVVYKAGNEGGEPEYSRQIAGVGPKAFLSHLFRVIGRFTADVELVLTHSGQRMRVIPRLFIEQSASPQALDNPSKYLLGVSDE